MRQSVKGPEELIADSDLLIWISASSILILIILGLVYMPDKVVQDAIESEQNPQSKVEDKLKSKGGKEVLKPAIIEPEDIPA